MMKSIKKPNLIFIMSDQQRFDTISCYGNDWINTPNLNKLSEESFVFKNAYVTQPVCAPARGSIISGLYPHSHGAQVNMIPMDDDVMTIAQMFDPEYKLGYFGKWHLGADRVKKEGWDEWISTEEHEYPADGKIEYPLSDYHNWLVKNDFTPTKENSFGKKIFSQEHRATLPPEFQMASFLAQEAEGFIKKYKDEPFVLFVNTFEPHSPYSGPYNGMYEPHSIPTGPTFLKEPHNVSDINIHRAKFHTSFLKGDNQSSNDYMNSYLATCGEDFSTEEGWLKLRADYFANITLVDEMVGKINDSITSSNIEDNTVVIFTSDHGDMMGDHGMIEKRTFYEESAKVPMLFKIPWLKNKVIEGDFSHIDLVPTILKLMNQEPQSNIQGKDISSIFLNGNLLDNEVVIEWNGTGSVQDRTLGSEKIDLLNANPRRSIIINRMKLNLTLNDSGELFDLNEDPYEENNLYYLAEYQEIILEMKNKLIQWQINKEDYFIFE